MRSLDRYVLALVITVFLGVSGGAAAGFAVGSGNDNTPPSDTVVTDYRESTPLPGVAGDQSSDVGYSDMYQVGEQKVRTSPTASGNYPASGTTRMGENDVVASVVPPFSVSMGESAAAWVALSQRLFSVQWAGGLSATGLLMPLGDVNLDGMVTGITHIKLPGSKQRTILDESHRSITHGCRQPSNQAHKTISRRGELAAPGSGGGFHHVCTPFKLLRARTSPLVASLHL